MAAESVSTRAVEASQAEKHRGSCTVLACAEAASQAEKHRGSERVLGILEGSQVEKYRASTAGRVAPRSHRRLKSTAEARAPH